MDFEHFERGYLLPNGCKDLIDVIKLHAQCQTKSLLGSKANIFINPKPKIFLKPGSQPLTQPVQNKGEVLIPESTNASQLAALLGQQTSKILADAMHLGVFATPSQTLSFEVISKIARKYGFSAKSQSSGT